MIKKLLAPLAFVILLLAPAAALADVPSLQVAPLSYSGNLKPGVVASGYVDVANPGDETITIVSSVQGFRQIDTHGDLAFYSSSTLSNAIKVGLPSFQLGPREAIRVTFTVNAAKLPQGGVYAAIFFRTQPAPQQSDNSFVVQSANVGTLLILTNGGPGAHRGAFTNFTLPAVQLGSGLSGMVRFQNTDRSLTAVAFKPKFGTRIYPWGKLTSFTSGLVLPGVTRQFSFSRPGSFFGIIPLTVTDASTGDHATRWVLAVTGVYRFLVPLGLLILIAAVVFLVRRRRSRPASVTTDTRPDQVVAGNDSHEHSGLNPTPTPDSSLESGGDAEPKAQPDSDTDTRSSADSDSDQYASTSSQADQEPEPDPIPNSAPELSLDSESETPTRAASVSIKPKLVASHAKAVPEAPRKRTVKIKPQAQPSQPAKSPKRSRKRRSMDSPPDA